MKLLLLYYCSIFLCFLSCQKHFPIKNNTNKYAQNFKISHLSNTTLTVYKQQDSITYLLLKKDESPPTNTKFDYIINVPINKFVATSTTYIPYLEAIGVEKTLVGLQGKKYISSAKTKSISHQIKELSFNQNSNGFLNIELLISLHPDLIMMGMPNTKTNQSIKKAKIPILLNNDWKEASPLARMEWIKVFGVLYDKEQKADSVFNAVISSYQKIVFAVEQKILREKRQKPSIIYGAMYEDVWRVPSGESWLAQLFADAGGDYIFKELEGGVSVSLRLETVIEKGQNADFWIGSNLFTSYQQLIEDNKHNSAFKSFKTKQIYTYKQDANNAIPFYEQGAFRYDLVVKDFAHILYPDLFPNYTLTFFKPLEE